MGKGTYSADKSKNTPLPRKKRRFRPGTVAKRNIRKYQKSQKLLLASTRCKRLARYYASEKTRFTKNALHLFHESLESYAVNIITKGQKSANFNGRKKIKAGELELVNNGVFFK